MLNSNGNDNDGESNTSSFSFGHKLPFDWKDEWEYLNPDTQWDVQVLQESIYLKEYRNQKQSANAQLNQWIKSKPLAKPPKGNDSECLECHKTHTVVRSDQRYCSADCKANAFSKRRAARRAAITAANPKKMGRPRKNNGNTNVSDLAVR